MGRKREKGDHHGNALQLTQWVAGTPISVKLYVTRQSKHKRKKGKREKKTDGRTDGRRCWIVQHPVFITPSKRLMYRSSLFFLFWVSCITNFKVLKRRSLSTTPSSLIGIPIDMMNLPWWIEYITTCWAINLNDSRMAHTITAWNIQSWCNNVITRRAASASTHSATLKLIHCFQRRKEKKKEAERIRQAMVSHYTADSNISNVIKISFFPYSWQEERERERDASHNMYKLLAGTRREMTWTRQLSAQHYLGTRFWRVHA